MGFLKLTPKPPRVVNPQPPRAVVKPQATKRVRSISGLSQEEIQRAIEKEYIDRGAIILRFDPTAISNFRVSIDGRFGLRHNERLNFYQLFIFKEKKKIEDFVGLGFDNLKLMESTQLYYFYNDKIPTADMQRAKIAEKVCSVLGEELEVIVNEKKKNWYAIEDEQMRNELEAARIGEEMETLSEEVETKNEDAKEQTLPFVEEKQVVGDFDFLLNI